MWASCESSKNSPILTSQMRVECVFINPHQTWVCACVESGCSSVDMPEPSPVCWITWWLSPLFRLLCDSQNTCWWSRVNDNALWVLRMQNERLSLSQLPAMLLAFYTTNKCLLACCSWYPVNAMQRNDRIMDEQRFHFLPNYPHELIISS